MPDFGLRTPDVVGIFTDTVIGEVNPGAPALTITELTGAQRTIVLRNRALPYAPVSWSGRMRTKLTWYQGNPVATQQVLGPELDNTTMSGKWKDRFMFGAEVGNASAILVNGSPDEVRSAEQAVALFEEIRRSGNTLRVTWGPETRTGILVFFDAKYDRLEDCSWSAEFEWNSKGESEIRTVTEPVGATDLLADMNSLDDLLGFSPEDVAAAFNAQVLDSIDSVRELTGELFSALRAIETAVSVPGAVVGKVLSTAESIRLELTEEIQRFTESSVAGEDEGVSVTARAAEMLTIEGYRRSMGQRASAHRATSLEIARQVELRSKPTEVAIITMPENTTLYSVSLAYYGTPDFASFLARVNGLPGALVAGGTQLRIPPRPPAGDDQSPSPGC